MVFAIGGNHFKAGDIGADGVGFEYLAGCICFDFVVDGDCSSFSDQ